VVKEVDVALRKRHRENLHFLDRPKDDLRADNLATVSVVYPFLKQYHDKNRAKY
jgi:hypothetical protein